MATVYVPLSSLSDNPFNTRSVYDPKAVAELADAIERDGMLATPTARLVTDDGRVLGAKAHTDYATRGLFAHCRVELASGGTRRRAWELAWTRQAERSVGIQDPDAALPPGLRGVPEGTMAADLRPITDDGMERAAWEENERRRDLDPVDRAAAIAARVARHGWTHEQAGEALGLDRSTVSNILRWFEAFSADETIASGRALDAVRAGEISESRARVLAGAFIAKATHAELYRRLLTTASIRDLWHLTNDVAHAANAEDARSVVEGFVSELESEAQRIERERAPVMFDNEPATSSENTPESDKTSPAVATPITHAACSVEGGGSDEDGVYRVEGLGADWRAALADAKQHTDARCDVHPCSPELARFIQAEGGVGVDVHLDDDGVLQLSTQRDDTWEGRAIAADIAQHEAEFDDGGAELAAVAEADGMVPHIELDEEDLDDVDDRETDAAETDEDVEGERVVNFGGAQIRVVPTSHGCELRMMDAGEFPVSHTGYRACTGMKPSEVTSEYLAKLTESQAKDSRKRMREMRAALKRCTPEYRAASPVSAIIAVDHIPEGAGQYALTAPHDHVEDWLAIAQDAIDALADWPDPDDDADFGKWTPKQVEASRQEGLAYADAIASARRGDFYPLACFYSGDIANAYECKPADVEAARDQRVAAKRGDADDRETDAAETDDDLPEVIAEYDRVYRVLVTAERGRAGIEALKAAAADAQKMADDGETDVIRAQGRSLLSRIERKLLGFIAHGIEEATVPEVVAETTTVGGGAGRDSSREPWDDLHLAIDAALAELTPQVRRVLTPALWPDGFRKGITTGRWRDSGAWRDFAGEMIGDALIDDHTPEQAAEALGLEVAWSDVSTDTTVSEHTRIQPTEAAAADVEAGMMPETSIDVSREAVRDEIAAHIETAHELRRLRRHKHPKRQKEMLASAAAEEDLANAKLEQFQAIASAADVQWVCDELGISGSAVAPNVSEPEAARADTPCELCGGTVEEGTCATCGEVLAELDEVEA